MGSFMDSAVTPSADALVQQLPDGEAVLLHLSTEHYFGLDEVGSRMWEVLCASPRVADAYARLLDEYNVEPAALKRDLEELVVKLVDRGLLEISPA